MNINENRIQEQNIKPLLQIQDLVVNVKKDNRCFNAVDSININIFPGEFVALAGESGSGKTLTALSCMNLLSDNVSITSGKIFLDGTDLTSLDKKNKIIGKDIAMIFQDPSSALDPLQKIGKQITESALIHGMSKAEAKSKALELLSKSGFTNPSDIFNYYPHELSGGMKQRVMIASCLINSPKILIADEPTTALDASIQDDILNIICTLNKTLNTSMLLITHDLNVVKKICSRIYIMLDGKIVESGNVNDVLSSPKENYTKALIDAIPSFSKRGKKLETFELFENDWRQR